MEPRHGFIENINADNPRDRQRFRIMVQDCVGPASNPLVNVYCGGFLRATIGAAPDTITMAAASDCSGGGPIWRAADLVVHVDAVGVTTGCDVTPLRAADGGADIRMGDVSQTREQIQDCREHLDRRPMLHGDTRCRARSAVPDCLGSREGSRGPTH
jgi:hypothetical protein